MKTMQEHQVQNLQTVANDLHQGIKDHINEEAQLRKDQIKDFKES